tara:strand:- start:683 stop:1474 length:792 start_codon:yes stop_codon:yes gene_type:complete
MTDLKKKMNNCFITKDYKLFTKTKGNRPINLAHVEKIKKAIARKDLKLPILVTKKMHIRDGHHTFQARMELGLEIYCIVLDSDDAFDMALLNSNRSSWSYSDYLNFFCTYQKKNYMTLRSKINEYNMPIQETICIFVKQIRLGKNHMEDFKNGEFKIPDGATFYFDRIAREIKDINNILDETKKIKRGFVRAYLVAVKCPNWNFLRFKAAMKSRGSKVLGAESTEEYITQFQNIFNSGLKSDKKIKLTRFFEDKDYEGKEAIN